MTSRDSYGAALLRAAIRTIFPKATILGSTTDPRGFSATFSDDHPFQEGYLKMLESAMHKLQKEPLQIMEMLGPNAMEMLAHYEQPCPHPLSGPVFVLKLGSFFEVCEKKPLVVGEISLMNFSQKGRCITVRGKAFESHPQRQQFEKRYRKWVSHDQIAKSLELYEGDIWHARGVLFKQLLLDFQRKFFQSHDFLEIEAPDPIAYAKKHRLNRVGCGGIYYLFGSDALNSSLQIIQKWITLFKFESQWIPETKELGIIDFLGCYQRGAHLEPVGQGFRISLADQDLWAALVLEKDRGELPNWLAPEQVRLLTEKGIETSQVTKIFRIANIRYIVDRGEDPLKEKMYRALRVNVPYVMVFGKREEAASQMMIRASSSKQKETIFLTQLHQFLSELQIESE